MSRSNHNSIRSYHENPFYLTVAAAALFLLASPAAGQTLCGKHSDIIARLAARYAETPHFIALTDGNWMAEILVSEKGETWSLVITNSMGTACITASGKNWRAVKPKPEGTPL